MKPSDKRKFTRFDSSLFGTYRIVNKMGTVICQEKGIAINISKTGLLLQTNRYIIPETKLDVALDIDDTTVHLKCQCMYCRESGTSTFEAGIHILKINKRGVDIYFTHLKKLEKKSGKTDSLRPESGNITDVVRRIAAEHKIITQYVTIIQSMVHASPPDLDQIGTLLRLMKADTKTHFHIEETLFFDVARKTLPGAFGDMVSKLTLEHRKALKDIDILIESIDYRIENNEPVTPALKEAILALTDTIKAHAKFELTELFPAIEDNPDVKKRILDRIREIAQH